jgi:GTP 3',8-cyclase
MLDRFNRKINYLRISVTDRCNLRCRYCMPEEGVKFISHNEILSFEEIQEVVQTAVPLGINKVRLTGGEPLVRKDIINLVRMIAGVDGVKDLAMTTNGLLLSRFARPLTQAGLQRINISLDTIDAEKFAFLTRGGKINEVFEGIKAARKAGLAPIKINCVVGSGPSEADALSVKAFCMENDLQVRFIKQMDLETGDFGIVHGGSGGDCSNCNRLRITSNGMIKPCLFSNHEFSIRSLGIENAIHMALGVKPEKGMKNINNCFHNIGG